jgi:hypothetical protein
MLLYPDDDSPGGGGGGGRVSGASDSADREDIDVLLVGTTGIIGATEVSISGNLNSDLNLGASYISFESSSSTISLIVPFFKPNDGSSRLSSSIIDSSCVFLNCLSFVDIFCFSTLSAGDISA